MIILQKVLFVLPSSGGEDLGIPKAGARSPLYLTPVFSAPL